MGLEIMCLIYMHKKDLAFNVLQWLICHKNKPNESSQDIEIEFEIEKYAVLNMKKWRRETMEGTKLSNQESIRTLEEKKIASSLKYQKPTVWNKSKLRFGWVLWHINQCILFNTKSS